MGQTWAECPGLIAMLSLPIFVCDTLGNSRALRRQISDLPAAVATFAGAAGVIHLHPHCPEMDAPFAPFGICQDSYSSNCRIGAWLSFAALVTRGPAATSGRSSAFADVGLLAWLRQQCAGQQPFS